MTRLTAIARWAERANPGEGVIVDAERYGMLGDCEDEHRAACALVNGGWAVHVCRYEHGRAQAVLWRTNRAWDAKAYDRSLEAVTGAAWDKDEARTCIVCGSWLDPNRRKSASMTCSRECERIWRRGARAAGAEENA